MKFILLLLLLIPSVSFATCTTTVGKIPVTTTGTPTPQICDGDVTDTSGNIGIGTTVPINQLDIQGTVNTNVFEVTSAGNIGIGSAIPGQKLDVQGTFNRFDSMATGKALCFTASNLLGHCTTTPTNGSCTCTQG